jgi:hypothetical protein
MATTAQIRSLIQAKVFDTYPTAVTYLTRGTPAYDERGSILSSTVYTSASINVVPYDITKDSLEFQSFSDFKSGDMTVAIPYTRTVTVGDRIYWDSVFWEVKELFPQQLISNLVHIAHLTKVVA